MTSFNEDLDNVCTVIFNLYNKYINSKSSLKEIKNKITLKCDYAVVEGFFRIYEIITLTRKKLEIDFYIKDKLIRIAFDNKNNV